MGNAEELGVGWQDYDCSQHSTLSGPSQMMGWGGMGRRMARV